MRQEKTVIILIGLLLVAAFAMPILNRPASATTTTVSTNTSLGATTIAAGDTLIINPGITLSMSGPLVNQGNIVNSGTIQLNDNVLNNYGIIIDAAGGNIGFGTVTNYSSGLIKEDTGTVHAYFDIDFNNYGKHVTFGAVDMTTYDERGAYKNYASGMFESNGAASFSRYFNYGGNVIFHQGASFYFQNSGGGYLYTNGTIDNYGTLSPEQIWPGQITIDAKGVLNNHPTGFIVTKSRPSAASQFQINGVLNNEGRILERGHMSNNGILNNYGSLENVPYPGEDNPSIIDNQGKFNNALHANVTNYSIINNAASGAFSNQGNVVEKCNAQFNNSGAFTGNPIVNDCSTLPIVHMSDTTASSGYGVHAPKPARTEFVSATSQLVSDKIDSITLRLKKVGSITGTAEIGIFNPNFTTKKAFGTLNAASLTTSYQDYEFKLSNNELYTIQSGDRIGIKYAGGDANNWISVMLDLDSADPFDGTASYQSYYQSGA